METFSQFHFLRPEWLVLLLTLPLLWWINQRFRSHGNEWSKSIDPTLLSHLTETQDNQISDRKKGLLYPILILITLALAGPTWEQKPQPVVEIKDDMVVILDLSISMLSGDLSPNRLTRTKQKLQDLLSLRTEGQTALIAFSGDSHVVTPLTDDTKTIIANLPALDPFMMPVIGSRPELAVQQAIQLLEQGQSSRGRIILLGDGIAEHQAEKIKDSLANRNVSLSILAAGTATGAPIDLKDRGYLKDDGKVVIPKTDFKLLNTIANDNGGRFVAITLDDSDLIALDIDGNRLLSAIKEENETTRSNRFDQWEDAGFWLLLAIIPLVLLAHRQGALLILLLFLLPLDKTIASEEASVKEPPGFGWQDFWQTRDQQAQAAMNAGDYSRAATLFESPEHKAYAHYQSGDYAQSEQILSGTQEKDVPAPTSRHFYNLGNSLAKQMKLEDAIAAYQQALDIDQANEDALFNKQLLEQLIEQQSQQNSDQKNSDAQDANQDQQQDANEQNESEGQQQDSADQNSQEQSSQDNGDPQRNNQQGQQSRDQQSEQNDPSKQQPNDPSQSKNENSDGQEGDQEEQSRPELSEAPDDQQEAQEEAPELGLDNAEPLSQEEQQSFEQWMRRVPDDPGGLLRRKFEQQARERNRERREEGEPLW